MIQDQGADALRRLEYDLARTNAPRDERVAAKLALSKTLVDNAAGPLHVSIVLAMYKETERILTPEQSPIGEDFVNVKVNQLRWLFGGDDGWDLIMVDDGCPDGSGELAESIIDTEGCQDNVRVLYIEEAISESHPAVAGLGSPDDSRKGGSIHYGMHEAATRLRPGLVVAYTDADTSTDLGQAGNLVGGLNRGELCAAASRREPESVVVKSEARNHRGKLFIYIWKQMLPQLRDIIDSQCGFKAFPGAIVHDIAADPVEQGFAFDLELLLRCELDTPGSVSRVPIAWIDSEAGSTTADLEPYLPMLRAVARMYRRYSPPDDRPEAFARLVDEMSQDSWSRLLDNIPTEITDRDPIEFSTWAGVEAEQIARAAFD